MNYRYSILFLILIFLIACKKEEPIASFSASKITAEVDEVISFSNSSDHSTSYSWDFGDGTASTQESPTHAFTSEGSFNVELTAKGEGGSDVASQTITVAYPDPVAAFTADKTSAEVDEIITFTNQSDNAVSYSWSFGDGTTSTDLNPTHVYTEDGTFTVQLTSTGPGGATNSTTSSITVEWPDPTASFTTEPDPPEVEPGETITFTNASEYAESYVWDFGDGSTSTVTDPTHPYTADGIYTVQLTATGFNGETDSYSTAVTVALAPVADFTISNDKPEIDETITFTNLSQNATSYSWDFGDGSTSTDESPTHSFSSEGTYSVTLTATGLGGTDSDSQDVGVFVENISPFVGDYIISKATLSENLELYTNEIGPMTLVPGLDITEMIQTALLGAIECEPENSLIELREDFSLYLGCTSSAEELDAGTWEEISETEIVLNMNSTAIPASPTGIVITVTDITLEGNLFKGSTTVPISEEMLAGIITNMSGGLLSLNEEETPPALPVSFIIELLKQ
jgi:PKD repeat protein